MASWFSLPGAIGLCVGALVGWINFKIVTGLVVTKLRHLDRSASAEERRVFEDKIALMRRLVFVLTVPVVALVGYWLGRTLGG